MMTEFEAGVRELVARLRDFERRMKKVEDDAGALDQMVKMITPGLGFGAKECVTDFPFVCDCIPPILKIVDSLYGDTPIAYDQPNLWWRGCKVVAYPGSAACAAAASTMIRYTLQGTNASTNWSLKVEWRGAVVGGFTCPVNATTCATTPNLQQTQFSIMGCSSPYWGRSFNGATQNQPWPTNPTLSVENP